MEEYSGVAFKYARVGTHRAFVTRGPAGFVRVYTTDHLTAEIHTNFAPSTSMTYVQEVPIACLA